MKLDCCYYCDGFVSTHKHNNIMVKFLTLGSSGSQRVCNNCGNKTYKRKYKPRSEEDKNN